MGAQLSTDLRHITVGTGRQHAGGGSISAGEGKLLAEPDYLALKAGNPRFEIINRRGFDRTCRQPPPMRPRGLDLTHRLSVRFCLPQHPRCEGLSSARA